MPNATDFQAIVAVPTATIANGATTSGAIDLGGCTLAGIQLPAAFTGTSLKFQAATTLGGTYQTLIDGLGNDVSKTVAQGKFLRLSPGEFAGVQFLKIVSGSAEGGARTLELAVRPV